MYAAKICVCKNMEETIVLYPSPEISHLVAMVELGKLILTHHPSFSLTILITNPPYNTSYTSTAPYINRVSATTPSINFHHLPTISLPLNTSSLHPKELSFEFPRLNNPNLHKALQTISQTSMLRALVIDFFCNAAFDVATILNIPTYYFHVGGASGLATFLYLPTIDQNTTKSFKDLNTHLDIPGLGPVPSSDMPTLMLDRTRTIYQSFLNTAIQMSKSKGIILNTVELLETRAIKAITDGFCVPNAPTPPIFCVGPLTTSNPRTGNSDSGEDEHECLIWLNSQPVRSVVFLSFGGLGLFSAKQLKDMAIGLEKSGHRFLWVVRSPPTENNSKRSLAPPEPDLDVLLPQGFMDRTKDRGLVVKSWAPQVDVLNHESVGGFVTHCGWCSALESVCAGVPMVTWPLHAEQKLYRVCLVEEMKVALRLNELEDGFVSAAELEERLRELMDSERGKEVRERVMVMRECALAAMGEGGTSRIALAKLAESWKRGRHESVINPSD